VVVHAEFSGRVFAVVTAAMLATPVRNRQDAIETNRLAEESKYFNQEIARSHTMRRFGQIAIFLKDAFDIATLNCANESSEAVFITKKRKRQGIEPCFVEKQVDGELPLAHEPVRLIENDMKTGSNFTEIQQTQAITGFEVKRSSNALDR